jgi:hypothetical protein
LVLRSSGLVAVIAVVTIATGCGDSAPPRASEPPPPLDPSSFSLWLSASQVTDREPVELVAALVNHDGTNATFGVAASIDRWDGRAWLPHRQLVMCLDHWFCTAEPRKIGEIDGVPSIGLSATLGSAGPPERFTTKGLTRGWYRLSQAANETLVARAIFELATDAAPIAPLEPMDEPMISVAPVVVPTKPTSVRLTPLVKGAHALTELERAVAGLAETSAVQRWNGHTWQPVATLPLRPVDQQPLGRQVELPALEEGAYRLVRSGPNGDHTGRFWVDESAE